MGSSASKTAQKGARKFPTRAPGAAAPPPPRAPRKTAPPSHPKASYTKDEEILTDSINPSAGPNRSADPTQQAELISRDFSARLRRMGVAEPHPTYSPSSTASVQPPQPRQPSSSPFSQPSTASAIPRGETGPLPTRAETTPPPARENQTLTVLEARRKLQEKADREFLAGGDGDGRREFLHVGVIRDALALRERGVPEADIEARLGLKGGVVGRLGVKGMVANVR